VISQLRVAARLYRQLISYIRGVFTMGDLPVRLCRVGLFSGILLLLAPLSAQAYVGPGAGLSAIGSVVALLIIALLLIAGFLWYPLKQLRKRRKSRRDADTSTLTEEDSDRATGL